MEINIKDYLKITMHMAKELTTGVTEKSMKDFSKMARNMVTVDRSIPMEISSKAFTPKISSKVEASTDGMTAKYTRDNIKMT